MRKVIDCFDFEEAADTKIHSKELWIRRAVSNLLLNAREHGGGTIGVRVTSHGESVIICVTDEGAGLKEEEIERLFDYQYRVKSLKKDGYGIGLSLVRHVCELSGGLAWAERGREKGMEFYMVFPKAFTPD